MVELEIVEATYGLNLLIQLAKKIPFHLVSIPIILDVLILLAGNDFIGGLERVKEYGTYDN
jgi:hypothetical protein